MARLSRRSVVDNIADGIWLIFLLGTIFGCWIFYQVPYGDYRPDDYAVIIFRVMTGITLGFVLSGFIVIPLREVMKPQIYNLQKRPRLRRAWSI